MAYKLLIVEDEKEKATGIAYLTGKYNPECRRILLLRISECLKWTDWK